MNERKIDDARKARQTIVNVEIALPIVCCALLNAEVFSARNPDAAAHCWKDTIHACRAKNLNSKIADQFSRFFN